MNKSNNTTSSGIKQHYYDSEDDNETLATAIDDLSSLILYSSHSTEDIDSFQNQMQDPTNPNISTCQNTYFMDGGVRFISVRQNTDPLLSIFVTDSFLVTYFRYK